MYMLQSLRLFLMGVNVSSTECWNSSIRLIGVLLSIYPSARVVCGGDPCFTANTGSRKSRLQMSNKQNEFSYWTFIWLIILLFFCVR